MDLSNARNFTFHYVTMWIDNTYDLQKWAERRAQKIKWAHEDCEETDHAECQLDEQMGEAIKERLVKLIDSDVVDQSSEGWVTGLLRDLLDLGDSVQWRAIGLHYMED